MVSPGFPHWKKLKFNWLSMEQSWSSNCHCSDFVLVYPKNGMGAKKEKIPKQLGKECNYFRTDWWGIAYSKYVNKFQCISESIIVMSLSTLLIWKWLEVGRYSCRVVIVVGKTKFHKEELKLWQKSQSKMRAYIESFCF